MVKGDYNWSEEGNFGGDRAVPYLKGSADCAFVRIHRAVHHKA